MRRCWSVARSCASSGRSSKPPKLPSRGPQSHCQHGPPYIRRYSSQLNPGSLKSILPSMSDLVLRVDDTIIMAMSGGVDSSVALRILSEWPLNIHVFYMRNWDSLLSETPPDSQGPSIPATYNYSASSSSSINVPNFSPCSWQRDWESVQRVCDHVGIPRSRVNLVDLSQQYWTKVFEPAINTWEAGGTPNPDVACNREIKFGALVDHFGLPKQRTARERTFLATGHYARVARVPHTQNLCRALDMNKDQSYYLSSMKMSQVHHALFPIGELTKPWVRQLAKYYGLPSADREESMGICFVGERKKFGDFVSQYVGKPDTQGYLVDIDGKRLQPHEGLWYYTVGQRARIPGLLEPLYIAKKKVGESKEDILVVPENHPALKCTRIKTGDFNWVNDRPPRGFTPGGRKKAFCQIRHRMEEIPVYISMDWNSMGLIIDFQEEVPGVALGQVAAIWYEKWCLGSGVIKETWTADEVPIQQMDSKSWTSDNYWKYDAYVSAGMSIGSDARGRFGARPEEIEAARAEPSIDDSARDRLLEEGPDDEVAPGVEEGDEGSDREQTVQVVPSDRMTRQEAKQLVSNHGFWIEERIPQKGRRRPGRRKRRPLSLPSTTTLSRNNHSTHIVTKSASHSISASREDLHSS